MDMSPCCRPGSSAEKAAEHSHEMYTIFMTFGALGRSILLLEQPVTAYRLADECRKILV
jgi:hypothetical protein